jgi:pimeloyl-ACP methyl ester carboxylesterase
MTKKPFKIKTIFSASLFSAAILLMASCSKSDSVPKESTALPGLISTDSLVKIVVENYVDPWHKAVDEAGFVQKTAQIGTANISYVEGPKNGPALVMLHAQMEDWFDYSRVLPQLSKSYHIFVIDYHGHGKTTAPVTSMDANDIGNDLATFMQTKIGEAAYVTGNSSGGLLTAWLAANKPDLVKAVVLEDPPLFSSEYPRIKTTVAYQSFANSHTYVNSSDPANDFLLYWLNNSPAFVANYIGTEKLSYLVAAINIYKTSHPGEPVELPIPASLSMLFRGISKYDPHFGDAFYTGTWNAGFNHAEALKKIKCPVLLLQANYEVTTQGILDGAMDQDDVDQAMSLLSNGKYQKVDASHVVHLDKPSIFISIINSFFLDK